MITLASSSGKPRYSIKEYYLDTPSDIPDLIELNSDTPGSIARIISSGEIYIQNSQGQWILQPAAAGGSGGGGGEGGTGAPGVSIVGVKVNAQNHLICTMSNGTVIDAGQITVQPGVSVALVAIDANNHLIVTLSDRTTIDAGLIPTVGIKSLKVDSNNHLQVTLTNNTTIDAGEISTIEGISIRNVELNDTHNLICTLSDGTEIDAGKVPTGENGKSAYEIALENDCCVGTEQEWLDSLKGEPGEAGASGASITDVIIDKNYHLICVLSDGSTIDAGELDNNDGGLVQVTTFDKLPSTGKTNTLYVTIDTGKFYYWENNEYKTSTTQGISNEDFATSDEVDDLFNNDQSSAHLASEKDIDDLFKI